MTVADLNALADLIKEVDVHAFDDPGGFARMAALVTERRDEFLTALGGKPYWREGMKHDEIAYLFKGSD